MANIQERRSKDGKLISYAIRVHRGRDAAGKQLTPFTATFNVPVGWTDERARKAAEKEAILFEKQCRDGMIGANRQTFEVYSEYVMRLKEKNQKHRTVERYRELLARILPAIGHMKLTEIKPQHLNQFYTNLGESGIRKDGKFACKIDLEKHLNKTKKSKAAFAKKAGISPQVVSAIINGKSVSERSADRISTALGKNTKQAFNYTDRKSTLSNKTILEYHRLISTIFAQAEKEMLIPYNPARRASPPKLIKAQANYFQVDEVNRIIECLEGEPLKWKAITYLLMLTGCRRGEILGLKWDKVDLDKGLIRIENNLLRSKTKGIYEDTPKTGKNRVLQIPGEAVQLLKEYRLWYMKERLANGDRWENTNFLFVQETGKPMYPDSVTDWLGNFSKRHGLPHINPHAFRHTFASILISKGIDIVTVSKTLGHEKVSTTTDIYAELMKQASEEASECIADTILRRQK